MKRKRGHLPSEKPMTKQEKTENVGGIIWLVTLVIGIVVFYFICCRPGAIIIF